MESLQQERSSIGMPGAFARVCLCSCVNHPARGVFLVGFLQNIMGAWLTPVAKKLLATRSDLYYALCYIIKALERPYSQSGFARSFSLTPTEIDYINMMKLNELRYMK